MKISNFRHKLAFKQVVRFLSPSVYFYTFRARDPRPETDALPTKLSRRSITWNSSGENEINYVWYLYSKGSGTFFNRHSTTMNLMQDRLRGPTPSGLQRWPSKFIKLYMTEKLLTGTESITQTKRSTILFPEKDGEAEPLD